MEKIFKTIYEEILCNEEDLKRMNKNIENESLRILEKCKCQSNNNNDDDELLCLLDSAISLAAYKGFYLGMKYATKGIFTLLKD